MAVRLQVVLDIIATLDGNPNYKVFGSSPLIVDDYTAGTDKCTGLMSLDVPAAAVDQAVPFNGITAASTVLMFVKTGSLRVKINATTSAAAILKSLPADSGGFPVSQYAKLEQPGVFFWRGSVSALYLSNPALVPVRVYVLLTGEAS